MNELMNSNTAAAGGAISPFSSFESFASAQRIAMALAHSTIVPDSFRMKRWEGDNGQDGDTAVANCLIALQLANRMQADPFMIMQNLYIVHGRPAFSAQFIIAAINSSGRFTPLQFKPVIKDKTVIGCQAVATVKETGEQVAGPVVTLEMARAEGWMSKNGSKWKSMPEVMLRYRAAAFFGRLYAPDIMMGMQSREELEDTAPAVQAQPVAPAPEPAVEAEQPAPVRGAAVASLNAMLDAPDVDAVPDAMPEKPENEKTVTAPMGDMPEAEHAEQVQITEAMPEEVEG